jgi:hypothetical protein
VSLSTDRLTTADGSSPSSLRTVVSFATGFSLAQGGKYGPEAAV